jgi:hypothetical protein
MSYLRVSTVAVQHAEESDNVTTLHESTQVESHLTVSASGALGVQATKDTANNTAKITFFILTYSYLLFISASAVLFCLK